ncbi:MAG: hypothetical protein JWR54_1513 [Mucilaginibacter sp.]|jgi:hypothetical protein|nr:hypothetical protein [Mucilaginibacter sp.]
MKKNITMPNNIDSFISQMNALQSGHPDVDVSGKWHLHLQEGLLRFTYCRELPEALQLKCIAIFVATLAASTCVIGSY